MWTSHTKMFTCEYHIRYFGKMKIFNNVHIWSYTERHMISELNRMWWSYTKFIYQHRMCSHVNSIYQHHIPTSYTNITYQHHITNFTCQYHIWKSNKSHVNITYKGVMLVFDIHVWTSHVNLIYRRGMFRSDRHPHRVRLRVSLRLSVKVRVSLRLRRYYRPS